MKWVVGGMIAMMAGAEPCIFKFPALLKAMLTMYFVPVRNYSRTLYINVKQLAFTEYHGFDLMTLCVFLFMFFWHMLQSFECLLKPCSCPG